MRPICRPFPGRPEQIPYVRDFVTRHVRRYGCPDEALYNIVLCADELAANAVRHTASGRPGGRFLVTVRMAGGTVRVEVADEGPAEDPIPAVDDEYDAGGRGLQLVEALAHWSGYEATRFGGLAWFECALNVATALDSKPPATQGEEWHPGRWPTMGKHGQKQDCSACKGSGKQNVSRNGKQDLVNCSACNGTGKV